MRRDFDGLTACGVDEDTDSAGCAHFTIEDAEKTLMDDIGAGEDD